MKSIMIPTTRIACVACMATSLFSFATADEISGAAETAEQILDASGVEGGLIVHVGCGDGRLTAALRVNDRFIVHGLDREPENIERARTHIRSRRLQGKVSVDRFDGRNLPYAENLVNLLVAEDLGDLAMSEVIRVLAPLGVAYVRVDDRWKKIVKPWPEEIDEWTHFLHNASGNAVAQDQLAGPPRQFQWTAKPLWSRHHNTVPSVSAMVSSAGRLFTIVDEAPPAASGDAPDKWSLVGRDAFNGIELWRIPMPEWGWKEWSSIWEGRFNQPNQLAKRLVAVGDRVYVTLGFNAPLTALDAATGRIVRTYRGTEFTDEILYQDGTLILSINQAAQKPGTVEQNPPVKKSVCAVDADSGKVLWKTGAYTGISTKTGSVERVGHLMLAARGERVYLVNAESLVALDRRTGVELWTAPRPEVKRYTSRYEHCMSEMATLVATDRAVLFCQLEPIQQRIGWRVIQARLKAYSPTTGEPLWEYACGNWGHFCVPDVFVAQGLVWVHDKESMSVAGLDLSTGEERSRFSTEKAFDNGHHHRCYRNKATERFLVTSFRGVEFADWQGEGVNRNHWARGTCRLGMMPCNGMIYATPHPCDCYTGSLLNGLVALAPSRAPSNSPTAAQPRLEKGPAYAELADQPLPTNDPDGWSTYRQDAARSGHATSAVAAIVKPIWNVRLPGKLTPPVIGNGRVILASADTHTVYAIGLEEGKPLWRYTAAGVIDTPPTLYRGLAIFGCRDGRVYCLRASDGRLVWRFRAAPEDRLVAAFGALESAWPVNGSVLVQNGKVYVAAGRSSFLDGGIYAYALDPRTGKVLERRTISSPQDMPVNYGRNHSIDTGVLADLLVGDGERVYMRQRCIFGDEDDVEGVTPHLRATAGMRDDSWFNRTFWMIDDQHHGDLLVHDERSVYAVHAYAKPSAHVFFQPGGEGYALVATDRALAAQRKPVVRNTRDDVNWNWKPPKQSRWSVKVPVRVTAMVISGETLFAAGTPDRLDPDDPWATHEGRRGGVLLALAAADGTKQAEYRLESPPVFDGMAAADGRLIVPTADGRVICFGGFSR